jgi:hypothetical protein
MKGRFPRRETMDTDEEEIKESIAYLEDAISEYEKLVGNIGKNGLSASLVFNYRDEIKEVMEDLRLMDVDLRKYWHRIVTLDNMLRKSAQILVTEIGFDNFKQYQIINDPPKENWWWYINRTTPPPREEKKKGKLWKR